MDLDTRILELAREGFECSQIFAILALEMEGMENPDLVRAMSGLTGGMGHCGKNCGALTGGCCVLGLFTGRGDAEEMEHSNARGMIAGYVSWFEEVFGRQYGGVNCEDIIGGDFSKALMVCRPILEQSFEKIMEILQENGALD